MKSAALVLLLPLLGCSGDSATETGTPDDAVVSEPLSSAFVYKPTTSQAAALLSAPTVYVSVDARTFPSAALVTVRNRTSGESLRRPVADGGLDPVAIAASVGDRLELTFTGDANATVGVLNSLVPPSRRPRVVRTIPARGKKDVPLNAVVTVVFSEPVRPTSAAGIRLLQNGQPVSGSVTIASDGLRAEFRADQPLAPNATFLVAVSSQVMDVNGDTLEASVDVDFATTDVAALASITTIEPALFNPSGQQAGTGPEFDQMRSFEMNAVLREDGVFTGRYSIFYADSGFGFTGRIVCFAIRDGKLAWVGAILDSMPSRVLPGAFGGFRIGSHGGWRVSDNGPSSAGVQDQLSLVVSTDGKSNLGSALDFCNDTPTIAGELGELVLMGLISGDIVVSGQTPPTLPPPQSGHVLEFSVQPTNAAGGQVMVPAVQVTVRKPDGTIATDFAGSVAVGMATNSTGGTVSGRLRRAAVNGAATFNDLKVTGAPGSYLLTASAAGATSVNSAPFNILPP